MVGYTSSLSRSQSGPCESPYQQTPKMAGPKPRQSRDAAAMSKTTTIKITTRIITTHLPCLDTTITIKSHPPFFGGASVYFGEPRGDEVPNGERLGLPRSNSRTGGPSPLRTESMLALALVRGRTPHAHEPLDVVLTDQRADPPSGEPLRPRSKSPQRRPAAARP